MFMFYADIYNKMSVWLDKKAGAKLYKTKIGDNSGIILTFGKNMLIRKEGNRQLFISISSVQGREKVSTQKNEN